MGTKVLTSWEASKDKQGTKFPQFPSRVCSNIVRTSAQTPLPKGSSAPLQRPTLEAKSLICWTWGGV